MTRIPLDPPRTLRYRLAEWYSRRTYGVVATAASTEPTVAARGAERFFAAVAGGNLDALVTALAPDVVLMSDGGGKASAARRPIAGADKVARFLVGIAEKGGDIPRLHTEVAEVTGLPAIVGWVDAEPFGRSLSLWRTAGSSRSWSS